MYLRYHTWQNVDSVNDETTDLWVNEFTLDFPCIDIRMNLIGYGWKELIADENIPVLFEGIYKAFFRKNGDTDYTLFAVVVCERAPTEQPDVYQDVGISTGFIPEEIYDVKIEATKGDLFESFGGIIEDIVKGQRFFLDLETRRATPFDAFLFDPVVISEFAFGGMEILEVNVSDSIGAFEFRDSIFGHQFLVIDDDVVDVSEFVALVPSAEIQFIQDVVDTEEAVFFFSDIIQNHSPTSDVVLLPDAVVIVVDPLIVNVDEPVVNVVDEIIEVSGFQLDVSVVQFFNIEEFVNLEDVFLNVVVTEPVFNVTEFVDRDSGLFFVNEFEQIFHTEFAGTLSAFQIVNVFEDIGISEIIFLPLFVGILEGEDIGIVEFVDDTHLDVLFISNIIGLIVSNASVTDFANVVFNDLPANVFDDITVEDVFIEPSFVLTIFQFESITVTEVTTVEEPKIDIDVVDCIDVDSGIPLVNASFLNEPFNSIGSWVDGDSGSSVSQQTTFDDGSGCKTRETLQLTGNSNSTAKRSKSSPAIPDVHVVEILVYHTALGSSASSQGKFEILIGNGDFVLNVEWDDNELSVNDGLDFNVISTAVLLNTWQKWRLFEVNGLLSGSENCRVFLDDVLIASGVDCSVDGGGANNLLDLRQQSDFGNTTETFIDHLRIGDIMVVGGVSLLFETNLPVLFDDISAVDFLVQIQNFDFNIFEFDEIEIIEPPFIPFDFDDL